MAVAGAVAALAAAATASAGALILTVASAVPGHDPSTGMPVITITLDATSVAALAVFTRDNVGRMVSVQIDGEEMMRPVIREAITGGVIQASGNLSEEDAVALAARVAVQGTIEVELVAE
jgi:preprotein translocase subunit SecD